MCNALVQPLLPAAWEESSAGTAASLAPEVAVGTRGAMPHRSTQPGNRCFSLFRPAVLARQTAPQGAASHPQDKARAHVKRMPPAHWHPAGEVRTLICPVLPRAPPASPAFNCFQRPPRRQP